MEFELYELSVILFLEKETLVFRIMSMKRAEMLFLLNFTRRVGRKRLKRRSPKAYNRSRFRCKM